jgi:hypothetical protein
MASAGRLDVKFCHAFVRIGSSSSDVDEDGEEGAGDTSQTYL